MMALVIMMLHCQGYLIGQKIGMMARIICTGAIYQKVCECVNMCECV